MKRYNGKTVIKRIAPEAGRRILVISDIHGNLSYFEELLRKVGFCAEDILIIDGDFLEKGPSSLDTLRFVMELSAKGNTHAVCGNCDGWHTMFGMTPEEDDETLAYIRYRGRGLIWDMCREIGIDPAGLEHFTETKELLKEKYAREWDFLSELPHAIETEKFVFAHAGMDPALSLEENSIEVLEHSDALMEKGYSFEKWLIVGHWPVMLYWENIVSANPIIDREHRIISLDGGCVLKDDGQLNCLIIPDADSEDFRFEAYDPFPVKKVRDPQEGGGTSYYIRWGDSRVQILERGTEFSLCRHVRTGYTMRILTKYLFSDGEYTDCNDCTDYVLPLEKGDEVSVVETTSEGYFVKHRGISGWYYGELE
ncbi:MAG: metallophosphoesterase [Oscillospiraceae bacterium]|nr:metallophosphoesterase [Oscillospiraceae bacterium]